VRIKAMPVLERAMMVRRRAMTFLLSASSVRSRASPVVAHIPASPGFLRISDDATFVLGPFLEAGHTKSRCTRGSHPPDSLQAFLACAPAGEVQEKPSSAIIAPTSRRNRSNIIQGPDDNCLKSPTPRPIKVEPVLVKASPVLALAISVL